MDGCHHLCKYCRYPVASKSQVLFFPLLISCLISPFVSATAAAVASPASERERDLKSIGAKANVIKGEKEREREREAGSN